MTDLSLAEFCKISEKSTALGTEIERILSRGQSYANFVKMLEADVNQAIEIVQQQANVLQGANEDLITSLIITFLRGRWYQVGHDTNSRGHPDILVNYQDKYYWLAEAKIFRGNSELLQGFIQLCERYSTGTKDSACGALLIYSFKPSLKTIMTNWRDELAKGKFNQLSLRKCSFRGDLGFVTTHTHTASGLRYKVRHMGVVLAPPATAKVARA